MTTLLALIEKMVAEFYEDSQVGLVYQYSVKLILYLLMCFEKPGPFLTWIDLHEVAKLPVAAAALTTGASAVVEILFQEVAAGICRAKHSIIQYRILLHWFLNWLY
jgi:hypothetical protein